MGGARSRRKGHQFERDTAIELRGIFPKARRQLEYNENDCLGVDLQGTDEFRFQCKKLKKYAPITCIEEVQCSRELGDIPVLITAGDNKKAVAVLYWDDFLYMLKRFKNKA